MYQPNWHEQEPKKPQPARETNQIAISPQSYNAPTQKKAEQQEPQPARETNQIAISPPKKAEQQEPPPPIWWKEIGQHPLMTTAIIVGVLVAALILVVVMGYWFNWPWVGVNSVVSKITRTPQGTSIEYSSGKTLWDWLGLLGVLAIPVVVGFGVAWFTRVQQKRDQEAANRRAEDEQEAANRRAEDEQKIATDNQRETALQAYIDNMAELILDKQLVDEKWKVAKVRTLTVLPRLDGKRKRSVLLFLYESELIKKNDPGSRSIINLNGADLSGADLNGTDLRRVDLSEANLKEAILIKAALLEAYLSGAILSGANLSGADLPHADLKGAHLDEADLGGAHLYRVQLNGADLRRADLSGAYLFSSELDDANLCGAKMDNKTDLKEAKLLGAKYNTKVISEKDAQGQPVFDQQRKPVMIEPTQWPPDFDLKNKGAICIDS